MFHMVLFTTVLFIVCRLFNLGKVEEAVVLSGRLEGELDTAEGELGTAGRELGTVEELAGYILLLECHTKK